MIHDVDETLRVLLRREVLRTNDIEIAFDAPTKDWASRRNAPTIDVYLYDIRENLDRRQTMFDEVRDDTGRLTERRVPARWFNLSYLVTAWTQRPEDEHRLLSAVLILFLKMNAVPPESLVGSLAAQRHSVVVNIARPPSQDRAISDIWSALGGELKPSLDLVLTVPIEATMEIPMGPPVLEAPSVRVAGPSGELEAAMDTAPVRDLIDRAGKDGRRAAGSRRGKFAPIGFPAWAAAERRPLSLEEQAAAEAAAEAGDGGRDGGGDEGDGQAAGGEDVAAGVAREEVTGGNDRLAGRRLRMSARPQPRRED